MNSMLFALVAAWLAAATGLCQAADLYGRVLREPAVSEARPAVNRYRRAGTETRSVAQADNCNCMPGLYSVVWLTGDTLHAPRRARPMPQMAQEGKRFVPAVLAVQTGATVEFPIGDPFFHNVFSYSKAKRFDLGRYAQGESAQVTFDHPGIVKVYCEIHASMRAYIHVLETPFHAVSDEQGVFVIGDVPAGDYDLHVWQEGHSTLQQRVRVTGDSTYVQVGE